MKTKTQTKRFTLAQRHQETRDFVELCLAVYDHDNGGGNKELCNLTGLCLATIYRMRHGKASAFCRINTIACLGAAVGLKLEFTKAGSKLRVIK